MSEATSGKLVASAVRPSLRNRCPIIQILDALMTDHDMKYVAWSIVIIAGAALVGVGEFSRFSPPPNAPSTMGFIMILAGIGMLVLLSMNKPHGPSPQ